MDSFIQNYLTIELNHFTAQRRLSKNFIDLNEFSTSRVVSFFLKICDYAVNVLSWSTTAFCIVIFSTAFLFLPL